MAGEWTFTELGVYVRLLTEWRNKISGLYGYSGKRIIAEIIVELAIQRRTTEFTYRDITSHPDFHMTHRNLREHLLRLVDIDYLRIVRKVNGKDVYCIRVPGSSCTLDTFMEIMSIE